MVFDLRGALLRKAEVESARLDDFEFRLRVRTMRLLAPLLGVEAETLVDRIALEADVTIVASLPDLAAAWYDDARAEARRQLIAELGDPAPYGLA